MSRPLIPINYVPNSSIPTGKMRIDPNTNLLYYNKDGKWIPFNAAVDMTAVMRWKGSVDTLVELPEVDNEVGDVRNVVETGAEYCWDGEDWQYLGELIDLSSFYTKEEVDGLIGDINTILDNINGEVL